MNPNHEREFFRLAAVYLACRLKVMGGKFLADPLRKTDLEFDLLGMHDYGKEMELLVKESRVLHRTGVAMRSAM